MERDVIAISTYTRSSIFFLPLAQSSSKQPVC